LDRELLIVEEICKALNPTKTRYVLPFRFRNENGTRTSHHLFFVSKNFKGYHIMKGIMAKESSSRQQGVATFEYSPADKKYPLLFDLTCPLEDLETLLLNEFNGKTITFKRLYETHSVGRSFIDSNYKTVLRKLEKDNKLTAEKLGQKRRVGTFADDVAITFGAKESNNGNKLGN
jgi:hypothetical protein